MDISDFVELQKRSMKGDFIFVHVEPENAHLAELPSFMKKNALDGICHAELVLDPKSGKVLCANEKEVAVENWNKYHRNIGVYTLYLARVLPSTREQIESMVQFALTRVHTATNPDIKKNIDARQKASGIPVAGFFINNFIWRLKTNFPGTISSKEAALYIRSIKPDHLADLDENSISPARSLKSRELQTIYKAGGDNDL